MKNLTFFFSNVIKYIYYFFNVIRDGKTILYSSSKVTESIRSGGVGAATNVYASSECRSMNVSKDLEQQLEKGRKIK